MQSKIKCLRSKATGVCTLIVLGLSAGAAARGDEAIRAVWHVQEIDMAYFGLTTHYSCDGLRDKMRDLLKRLSVRDDFVVSVGCTTSSGPERHPMVRMVLANAVPATDEVTKTFATDPKRAELLARLQRKSKSPASDQPFDAVLKRVVLKAKDKASSGSSGDCELLEQVRRDVLPKLGAKVIQDNVRCTPHQGVVGNPQMEVELLVAAPAKT